MTTAHMIQIALMGLGYMWVAWMIWQAFKDFREEEHPGDIPQKVPHARLK
jgi:hypothetical protein